VRKSSKHFGPQERLPVFHARCAPDGLSSERIFWEKATLIHVELAQQQCLRLTKTDREILKMWLQVSDFYQQFWQMGEAEPVGMVMLGKDSNNR
jgi:hypothetical protein